MAKFVYSLQNVLDLKLKMESQLEAEYGLANARLRQEEDKLKELLVRKAGYDKRSKELMNGDLDFHEIRVCKQAIDAMKSAIRSQMLEIQVAEKNVELARNKLAEMMKERKTYEKLREKAFEEFKREIAYEENREIDELVSYNYNEES